MKECFCGRSSGEEIKPISFYLKQKSMPSIQQAYAGQARIVLRFPSLFSWGYPSISITPAFHRKRIRFQKWFACPVVLVAFLLHITKKAIELAKPFIQRWKSMDLFLNMAYSSLLFIFGDTRVGRASIPSTQVIRSYCNGTSICKSTPTVLIGESHLLDRLRSYPASLNAK